MTRKEFIKLIKSMPRKSEIKINGKEVDLVLSWNSTTNNFTINLTELKQEEENSQKISKKYCKSTLDKM